MLFIVIRLLAFLGLKSSGQSHLVNIFKHQPYFMATLILLTYVLEVIATYYSIQIIGFFKLNAVYIYKSIEIIQILLFIGMLFQEEKFLYDYLRFNIDRNNKFLLQLLHPIHNTLKICLALAMLPLITNVFRFNNDIQLYFNRILNITIIWIIVWLVMQIFNIIESLTTKKVGKLNMENFDARRFTTKAKFFKRIATIFIIVLGLGLTFMTFDKIRALGTGLLASAGLITAILGFAAQKSFSNLAAGMQIATAQPIKINDAVLVEGEFGTIEEILLTYLVIRLWDLRALVVPIDYFLSKPFINYTRNTTNVLSYTFLYLDYKVPIEKIREYLAQVLSKSKYWDGKTSAVHLIEPQPQTVKIRIMASAANPGDAFELKCELHEKVIELVNLHYPDCLPCIRIKT
jgi:small-conductance mechanosensitive channel